MYHVNKRCTLEIQIVHSNVERVVTRSDTAFNYEDNESKKAGQNGSCLGIAS